MQSTINKTLWVLFAISCVFIGLYPIIYFLLDNNFGLLLTKSQALLSDQIWNLAFYSHIILGGIALLLGWTQFSVKWRKANISLHRNIGKVYIIAALISGVCSLYIAQFATGAAINKLAFSLSGMVWLTTTFLALRYIKKGNILMHRRFMVFSYAICFSAVTLRIWLPVFVYYYQGDFEPAYNIVAWLSWVPNLIVAYYFVRRLEQAS